jgi:protein TonB
VSQAVLSPDVVPSSSRRLLALLGASIAIHVALLGWMSLSPAPAPAASRTTEMVIVEVTRPPPARVEPTPPPAPPKPDRPVAIHRLRAPPPPNDVPPPQVTPSEPPPVVIGLTLRSTTTSGSVAVPVGNTLAGKAPDRAVAPGEVPPPSVSPLYEVDSQPHVIGEVKIPYPEEARSRGLEGTVVLSVLVDETGKVRSVKVLSGPGGGLDHAAARAVERFRFAPATRKGQAVATEIRYSYTFLLD